MASAPTTKTPRRRRSPFRAVGVHVRRRLVAGVLLTIPLIATYLILKTVFLFLDGLLQPVFERFLGYNIPGAGLVAFLVLVYGIGLVGGNATGRAVISLGQDVLLRIPVINSVYRTSKQLVDTLAGNDADGNEPKRVVLVEVPEGSGYWALGFHTGTALDSVSGRQMAVIYVPTAPMPNSGWLALVPLDRVYATDIKVADAMRFVVSGGVLAPERIHRWRVTSPNGAAGGQAQQTGRAT